MSCTPQQAAHLVSSFNEIDASAYLPALARIFAEALSDQYRAWGCSKHLGSIQTGAITFVQRFGSSPNSMFICTSRFSTACSFATQPETRCSTRRRPLREASSIVFSGVNAARWSYRIPNQ